MQQRLEKYLQLCGNMFLPCFLFVIGLFTYLWSSNLTFDDGLLYHKIFLICNALLLLIFINFNHGRIAFLSAGIFIVYLLINYLKKQNGIAMLNISLFNNLVVLLPFNLMVFYLIPPRRFLEKKSFIYLLLLTIEYIVVEFLTRYDIAVSWIVYDINITALLAFLLLILLALFRSVSSGNIYDYSMLFAFIAVGLGCYLAANPIGLSLFFGVASVIFLTMMVYTLIYHYFYDEVTGLYSRKSYLRHAQNLPPKYSLGIIKIDSFDGLRKGLTVRQKNELITLVIELLQNNLAEDAVLYYYSEAEFVIIREKHDMKEMYAELENVRRIIATADFALYKHPVPVKITVSGGVAEKKRVDNNAEVVFARAEKAMNETLKFSGNIISPVPRSARH